jgi:hypothetical protein
MKSPTELREEAADTLDLARRARRLAIGLSQTPDQVRLNRYADELEKRAAELEQEATAAQVSAPTTSAPPLVTHQQQQVQQQQQQSIGPAENEAGEFKPKS